MIWWYFTLTAKYRHDQSSIQPLFSLKKSHLKLRIHVVMVSIASSMDSVVNVIQSEHGKLRQQQRRISSVDLKEAMKRGIQSKTMTPYGPNKGWT